MRLRSLSFLAASGLVASQPHLNHAHQHVHNVVKRSAGQEHQVATVIIYELDGHQISAEEVKQGIDNGTLVWSPSGDLASATSVLAVATISTSQAVSSPLATHEMISNSQTQHNKGSKMSNSDSSSSSSSDEYTSNFVSIGINEPFPDGQLACSTFPSEYGALALEWLGLDGWAGIQHPTGESKGYDSIDTVTNGANGCCEGCFCSYACPPGYQKSQWPSTQGSTGQSIGGIQCQNGKLHLTNSALSKSLCMSGTTQVNVTVQNKMSKGTAICRTDYPGTENMVIPLDANPGSTNDLTCPDSTHYFMWEGQSTSAQYYVNPAGTSVEEGCQWDTPGSNMGNFAPLNLGVGFNGDAAYLSIQQNTPTTSAQLDFTVEIVGENLIGSCKYCEGQFCSNNGCNENGCTVSISSGWASYVFS